jgi:hypothetical protein
MGGNMKNIKIENIFVCMLVGTTIMMVAGTSIAKNTTQQSSSPEIEWIHTFDSILNDRAYCVDQTADGGYIFTGSTIVTPPGYTELLLVKTDGNGEESWHNNFPIALTNLYGTVVHQTTDGGYIIVGNVGGSWLWDLQVTKADANGDLVWQKNFGKSDGPDHGSDILQTSDGGYIVLGDTSSYGQGSADLWLIKLAADGTEQWNKTIGGATFDEPKSFTKAIDGGYVIVGQTDAVDSMGDVWVVKTNEAGELSWQKTFGNSNLTENGVCIKTESNGYIILGNFYDANWTENPWLLRLDAQGTLTWDQQISVNGTVHGTSITTTTDGGYFITGSLYDMINYVSDAYLLKLNHQGATQWVKILDVSNGLCDEVNWGIQARDGGYVAVGSTGDLNNWTGDTYILKIEAEKGVVLDSVTGRFGVQAHVKNLGTTEATDVSVSIKITGGILHRINVSYMETISIPAGEETTVSCKPFLGLGSIDIAVTVNGVSSDYEGKQLIILTQVES